MILNNLQFSLRHLARQKLNTALHVIGLTLGISVCLLIGLFVRNELSYDRTYKNSDRMYRVNSVWNESNKQFNLYATPFQLAAAIRNEVSGIENVVMTRPQFKSVVEVTAQKLFKQDHILVIEPQFLDMFDIEIKQGTSATMSSPYQALLNETTAQKYFGMDDPIGKTFKFRNKFLITVVGVFQDIPSPTHLPASILLSYVDNEEFLSNGDTWYFGDFEWAKLAASVYVVLAENMDEQGIQTQLNQIADMNINSAATLGKNIRGGFELQAISDIHFDTVRFRGGPWVAAINISWLWFFAGIGILVLLLACINFLNLSTAQALVRAREIGVRKVLGAKRSQLLWQFFSEAIMITLAAGLLSIFICQISIPSLSNILDKQIDLTPLYSIELMAGMFFLIVLTAFFVSLFPAWFMASFSPVVALKSGKGGKGIKRTSLVWKSLVVTQFTISAVLLIAVMLIAQQAAFLHGKNLGFDKDDIVRVEIGSHDKLQSFSNELVKIMGVRNVSFSRTAPISDDHWWNTISDSETGDRKSVCAIYADEQFYSVFNLRILSGHLPRNIEKPLEMAVVESQVNKVVVNETLLKELGLGSPQEAVGKQFWWGGATEISGVVADFNIEPLQYSISPALIAQDESIYSYANIKIESGSDHQEVLTSIERVWKNQFQGDVFEYSFLDNQIESYYKSENRLYTLFLIFACMAILISCLGVWGLATYASTQRVKEIGIRKVLGASVSAILILLSRDFLVLIFIAFSIASPLTFYFISEWLSNFAYHINIDGLTFLYAGFGLSAVVMFTVIVQTQKAAFINPIESLKAE